MKDVSFPIFKTKRDGGRSFALDDPRERRKYFDFKVGKEIRLLQDYLRRSTFVAFLVGKKISGKGTYAKLFAEAVGPELMRHVSVGDIVRAAHRELEHPEEGKVLERFLKERYRGFTSLSAALEAFLSRTTQALLPTELILTLVEREIGRDEKKAVFIDGFPRNLDQVSYSLYFHHLMGYRDDPDFFVFVDVPESVIDERVRYRVVCPKCQTPRNLKLLRTKEIGYDAEKREFYLICDGSACGGARMVPKEGDELGIEAIRERIEADDAVMRTLMTLEGVPKVYLRNAIPAAEAGEYADDYEITPSYRYEAGVSGEIKVIEEPWTVPDEEGILSYSLLPPAVVVSLISQTAKVLGLR